ncbi:hypothetical protein A6U87_17525 [Rhizobium sp. AC44/96]|nr:hypothetical protein A6U87_17525 [Rhizobium sp. AC44/96]
MPPYGALLALGALDSDVVDLAPHGSQLAACDDRAIAMKIDQLADAEFECGSSSAYQTTR